MKKDFADAVHTRASASCDGPAGGAAIQQARQALLKK